MLAETGVPTGLGSWDGYPAARDRLLDRAVIAPRLSGDGLRPDAATGEWLFLASLDMQSKNVVAVALDEYANPPT